jgi:hypothetical protein
VKALTTYLIRLVGLAAIVSAAAGILATSALADTGSATASGIERQLYPATNVDPSTLRDSTTSPGHLGVWAREGGTAVSGIERQLVLTGTPLSASVLRDSSTDAGHLGRAQVATASIAEPGDGFAWGSVGAGAAAAIVLVALMALGVLVAVRKTRHEPGRA